MPRVDLEQGLEIPVSFSRILPKLLIALVLFGTGTLALAAAWFFLVSSSSGAKGASNIAYGVVSLLCGLLSLGIGGLCLAIFGRAALRWERYIIGKEAVQLVSRTGVVIEHIPYDNIEDVYVNVSKDEDGKRDETLVILVTNPSRRDTILGVKRLIVNPKPHFDYAVVDIYMLSPKQFRKKLVARWKKWQQAVEAEDPEEP